MSIAFSGAGLARLLALAAEESDRRYWVRLIAVGLLLRVAIVFGLLGPLPLIADADSYSREALLILAGERDEMPFFWPPGMPFLLAGIYTLFPASLLTARLVALSISLAQFALVPVVARQAGCRNEAARLAGWLAALYPPDLLMAGQTFSYPVTGVCVLTFAACGLAARRSATGSRRWVSVAGAGLALGFGILIRPSTLSLVAALPLLALCSGARLGAPVGWRAVLAWRDWPWGEWIAIGSIAGVIIAPGVLHNARTGGGYTLSTNNEWNFFIGNNRYTHPYKTGHFGQRSLDQLPPEPARYFGELLRRPDARSALMAEARRFIIDHPGVTAWRTASRIRAFWGFDHTMARQIEFALGLRSFEMGALLLLEAGGYGIAMLLAMGGIAWAWERLDRAKAWFLLGLVGAFQLPYAIAFAMSVYHVPVMGLVLVFAGVGAERLWTAGPGLAGRIALLRRPAYCIPVALFLLVQVEYGYYLVSVR